VQSLERRCVNVIVHSDRGSQYCSTALQDLILAHQLRCTMSAKGNYYDNACAESICHSLKVESAHSKSFLARDQMRVAVFVDIETDCNRQRRYSTLCYLSPRAFEARISA
jgi:putative transposase